MPDALKTNKNKQLIQSELQQLFDAHSFADEEDKQLVVSQISDLLQEWVNKIERSPNRSLYYYGGKNETEKKKNLLKPIQERQNLDDKLVGMQSMRSVEPSVSIKIKGF